MAYTGWNGIWLCAILLTGWQHLAYAGTGETSDMNLLVERTVEHRQGWGEPGHSVAAHAPGIEPMPLQVGDRTYDSGFGTHAPSETVVLLDGQFESFGAWVGIQRQPYDMGSVVFRVFVDGDERFNSGVVTQTTAPMRVDVSLKGAKALRLVTEDAGDGIICDMANWAEVELVPGPDARPREPGDSVNVAPFARVAGWGPADKTGTGAGRLEPIPEGDLFKATELLPGADGWYDVPAYEDGHGCMGLEWLERRRVKGLAFRFDGPSDLPGGVEVEYWDPTMEGVTPGSSRWQGTWKRLEGTAEQADDRFTFEADWGRSSVLRTGTLKVRFIFPAGAGTLRVSDIEAHTLTEWDTATLAIETEPESGGETGVVVYSGEVLGQKMEPWTLTVRHAKGRSWERPDRTVLRFARNGHAFGVAVDDVLENGAVYVESAGTLVRTLDDGRRLADHRKEAAGRQTILEQVRETPDQTFAQAIERVHRGEGDLGPTMISLSCDNRKFIVEREGAVSFDDDPAMYGRFERGMGRHETFSCRFTPQFGQGGDQEVARRLHNGWVPIPTVTIESEGVQYRQQTYVAPYGEEPDDGDRATWLGLRPLGVMRISASAQSAGEADATVGLHVAADVATGTLAELANEDGMWTVRKSGALLAVVAGSGASGFDVREDDGRLVLTGKVTQSGAREFMVLIPRWEGAKVSELAGLSASKLLADTEAYWQDVMAGKTGIDVPDTMLRNLIIASQVHCLLAARNDGNRTIAPWIASWSYGPLESESHSIVRGMKFLGHEEFARRSLQYFVDHYNEQGYLTTGYTTMGTGWHLWTLGEFAALARDSEWLASVAPELERVCRWVMSERQKTMRLRPDGSRVPEYGLMPPGPTADWNMYSYYFYANGYYYAGLKAAGEALAAIGRPDADAILADAEAYRDDIRRAFAHVRAQAPVLPLRDGTWVPAYPTQVYSPGPIGEFCPGEDAGRSWCYDVELGAHHLCPQGVLGADEDSVAWMMDHMEDVQFLRPGWFYYEDEEANHADWFNLGGFAKVQPYYARTGEVHALRDDVRPFIRSYFNAVVSLLNREDLSLWEHFVNDAYNKTHETGYFLHQTRLMFVQERGDELWLAPFITYNWLKDGLRVAVRRAPTLFGETGYTLESRVAEGFIDAVVQFPERDTPAAVVLRARHPDGKAIVSVDAPAELNCVVDGAASTVRMTPVGREARLRIRYAD